MSLMNIFNDEPVEVFEGDIFKTISDGIDNAIGAVVEVGYEAIYYYLEPAFYAAMGCAIILTCIKAAYGGTTAPIATLGQTMLKWGGMSVVLLNWDNFSLWVFDMFTNGPVGLSGAIVDAISTEMGGAVSNNGLTESLTEILRNGSIAAGMAWEGGSGWLFPGLFWIVITICTYIITGVGFALLMLAKVGTGLLLFFAPIPLIGFYFDTTRGWFTSWLQQLTNFAFLTVLVSIVLAVFSQIVLGIMPEVSGPPREIFMSEIGGCIIITIVMVVVLSQIPGQASSLAGGMQLTTMGVISGGASKARGAAGKAGAAAGAGLTKLKAATAGKLGNLKAVKGG